MEGKLLLASALTIFFLLSVVGLVVAGALYFFGGADLLTVIAFTVLFNVVAFFVSPWVQDFLLKWLHGAKFYTVDEFKSVAPEVSEIIERVSREHGFRPPKIVYIPDKNPTAFTYGSTRSRARIAITEGILEYLEPDERRAVIAHELGHIVHYDFAVMAGIATFLEIVYIVYAWSWRAAGFQRRRDKDDDWYLRKRGNPFAGILLVLSGTFYVIGRSIVLYLSRVREYYADEFAAKKTSPLALASALLKIAYGITETLDDQKSRLLLRSTEVMGIMGEKAAKEGAIFSEFFKNDPEKVGNVAAWDLYSPWAALSELTSTHPLTGKRIFHLLKLGGKYVYIPKPDMGKIYSGFLGDIFSYITYVAFPLLAVTAAHTLTGDGTYTLPAALMGLGAALIFQRIYSYPHGETKYATLAELLGDPYASPVRGKKVALTCKVIGKKQKDMEYDISEDIIITDGTGIIFANYESWLPLMGNILFALKEAESLINRNIRVEGWYFRGITPRLDLHKIIYGKIIKSYPYKMYIYGAAILFLIGVALIATTA